MCARNADPVSDRFHEAAIDALWRQWRVIGAPAAGGVAKRQVDPETLCLASLALEPEEPRLWDTMADWIRVGASLIGVQRLKNLAPEFANAEPALARLARVAVGVAKDSRWRTLLGAPSLQDGRVARPRRPMSGGPALTAPPALVLRLRAAFAVGVKADLIAFLLGQEHRVSVATATAGLGYSNSTVFRAFQDLELAGFVLRADQPSAAEYWIDAARWERVLDGPGPIPRWGYWRETLGYVCAVVLRDRSAAARSLSEYARGTELRKLAEQHESSLVRAGILGQKQLKLPATVKLAEWRAFHDEFAQALAAR